MKTIDLKKAVAIVDDDDFARINAKPWRVTTRGYAGRTEYLNGRKVNFMMHRVIMGLTHDDSRVVDHINHDQLDNRRENLRVCTKAENMCNLKLYVTNTSGFKGVCKPRGSKKWQATIYKNRKAYRLGYFDDPEVAHAAYMAAARRLHGDFASSGLVPEGALSAGTQ